MSDIPETRYAKSGDCHIAYQIVGKGPLDVVFIPGSCRTLSTAGTIRGLRTFTGTSLRSRVSSSSTNEELACRTLCPSSNYRRSSNAWTTRERSWTLRDRSEQRWSVSRRADR